MSLQWNVRQRKNPQDPNAPGKYYAEVALVGGASEEELYEEAAREMGMSESVVRNADDALGKVRARRLRQGYSVPLRNLGRIGVSLTSDGAATPEEVARLKKEVGLTIRTDDDLRHDIERAGFVFTGEVKTPSTNP